MYIYSCDLGGTNTKWGIFHKDRLVVSGEFKSNAYLGGQALLDTLIEHIYNIVEKYQIDGIAVSSAGTINEETGEVVQASDIIPGYQGMNIKDVLTNEFHVPVVVDNDVNCAMYAEAIDGSGKDASIVFGLTLGTGVGSAIVLNKEVYHGSNYFAGEIGYLRIGDNVLDLSGSTRGLAMRVATRKNEDVSLWDGKRVFKGYNEQDHICVEEIDVMTKNIAEVLKLAICFLNPDVIVIGGGVLAQKDILLPKIKEHLAKIIPITIFNKTSIKAASHENLAGIYGAYYLYKNKVKKL